VVDSTNDDQGTLKSGKGQCLQFAALTVSLCRSVNIPARCIAGYLIEGNVFYGHAWVEVYVGQDGWIPLDPTTGQLDFVDATHIGLITNSHLETKSIQQNQIYVIDYQPSNTAAVRCQVPVDPAQIWMMSKTLHYDVLEAGQRIGLYHSRINRANKRYYIYETLDIPGKMIKMNSLYTINEQGFAERYRSKGLWRGSPCNYDLNYRDPDLLKARVSLGEKQIISEIIRTDPLEIQADLLRVAQWNLAVIRMLSGKAEVKGGILTILTPDDVAYNNFNIKLKPVVNLEKANISGYSYTITGARLTANLFMTEQGLVTRMELPEVGMSAVLQEKP
jgi:hypothetical protein